jgi:hypothetical protein
MRVDALQKIDEIHDMCVKILLTLRDKKPTGTVQHGMASLKTFAQTCVPPWDDRMAHEIDYHDGGDDPPFISKPPKLGKDGKPYRSHHKKKPV